jgi:hypothetical protein
MVRDAAVRSLDGQCTASNSSINNQQSTGHLDTIFQKAQLFVGQQKIRAALSEKSLGDREEHDCGIPSRSPSVFPHPSPKFEFINYCVRKNVSRSGLGMYRDAAVPIR